MKNIYLYFGEDDYLVSEAAQTLVRKIIPGPEQELGLETIDGRVETTDLAVSAVNACIEALQTPSFFGGTKMVWFRDVVFLTGGASSRTAESETTKEAVSRLSDVIKNHQFPVEHVLLITAPKLLKTSIFYKACQVSGVVDSFESGGKPWEKERIAKERVAGLLAKNKLVMSPQVLTVFLNKVGFETRMIVSELDKLKSFLGDRQVATAEDIEEINSFSYGETEIWDVTDAVGERNAVKLLKTLENLSGQKNIAIPIATMTVNRLQDLLLIREALDKGWLSSSGQWVTTDSRFEIAMHSAGLKGNDWRLKKLFPQARKFTVSELHWARFHAMEMRQELVSSGNADEGFIIQTRLLQIIEKAKK